MTATDYRLMAREFFAALDVVTGDADENLLIALLERVAQDARPRWRPIEDAPRDFTGIMVIGIGADNRPMRAIVHWGCATHCFSSRHHDCRSSPEPDCELRWLGEMGTRYGIEFTHWQPLPTPPTPRD